MALVNQEQAMVVEITFAPPRRANSSEDPQLHRRVLERVPQDTADEMVRDFAAFDEEPSEANQRRLYVYQQTDTTVPEGEMIIGLDFGEIVALETRPEQ